MKKFLFLILFTTPLIIIGQNTYEIGILKYKGGGDWYSNPTSLPNLIKFANQNIGTNIKEDPLTVEVGDEKIFNYPFIHMTGHGNVIFDMQEANNLKQYLLSGGFLHIDDNYGMDPFVRSEMKKVFPETEFVKLGANHPIFHMKYKFKNGLPKIHEHDAKPAQAFGIFIDSRLVCLYTYESDLGDGWEDPEIHNNSAEKRLEALQMGSNILQYVFNGVD